MICSPLLDDEKKYEYICIAEDGPKKEPKRTINHGILYLNQRGRSKYFTYFTLLHRRLTPISSF